MVLFMLTNTDSSAACLLIWMYLRCPAMKPCVYGLHSPLDQSLNNKHNTKRGACMVANMCCICLTHLGDVHGCHYFRIPANQANPKAALHMIHVSYAYAIYENLSIYGSDLNTRWHCPDRTELDTYVRSSSLVSISTRSRAHGITREHDISCEKLIWSHRGKARPKGLRDGWMERSSSEIE
jgi:hypothetical protein